MPNKVYLLVADGILVLHVLFVIFVVLGLVTIYAGYFFNWRWIRNRIFRIAHLLAIGVVVLQSWLGIICPLTSLEMWLREQAGAATYSGSFIQHWMHSVLYYQAPEWVFITCYTLFGLLVAVSWVLIRPTSTPTGQRV